MTSEEIEEHVWRAIRATINKFREHPGYFVTESDITSYLYMRLYSGHLAVEKHDRKIYCVHREYPTDFAYERDTLAKPVEPSLVDPQPDIAAPVVSAPVVGQRGNYDLVVLDPAFVDRRRRSYKS